MEAALAQFQALNDFGEEISLIAQELGQDRTALEQLRTSATEIHLEILDMVYEKVPEPAREAVERAMGESVSSYERAVEVLEEAGALGDIAEEPPLPPGIPDELKDKLLKSEVPARGRP